jgi:hypothetical protein
MNRNHFGILRQGVKAWNVWREAHPEIRPDLSGALLPDLLAREINFTKTNLSRTIFYHADLARSMFIGANLHKTIFIEACLNQCFFSGTNLVGTSFNSASLQKANFMRSFLSEVDLSHADLGGADFRMTRLEQVNLEFAVLKNLNLSNASLENCLLYGIKDPAPEAQGLQAKNLIVTNHADPTVVVDRFAAAAALFAPWSDGGICQTVTERQLVLILGNFQNERRELLHALRRELKRRQLIPVVVHFDKPLSRTFLDVTRQIASLTQFVIVDFTPPHLIAVDFQTALPYFKLPVQAILVDSPATRGLETPQQYPWILEPYFYQSVAGAVSAVQTKIIDPVEAKAREIFNVVNKKAQEN